MDDGHQSSELVEPTPLARFVMSVYAGISAVILLFVVICGLFALLEQVRPPEPGPRTDFVSRPIELPSDWNEARADERYAIELFARICRAEADWCGLRYEDPSFGRLSVEQLVARGVVPPEVLGRPHGYRFEVSLIHQPCDVVATACSISARAASFWGDRAKIHDFQTDGDICILPFDGTLW